MGTRLRGVFFLVERNFVAARTEKSARGLAQSKTLARGLETVAKVKRFGVRRQSGAATALSSGRRVVG